MTQEKAEAKIKEYMQEICERTDKDDIYGGLDSLFEYEDDTDVVLCIREYLSEYPNEKVGEMLEELLSDRRKIKEEYRELDDLLNEKASEIENINSDILVILAIGGSPINGKTK